MRPPSRTLFLSITLLTASVQAATALHPAVDIECADDCPSSADEHTKGCVSHCSCSSHAPRQVVSEKVWRAPATVVADAFQPLIQQAPRPPDPNRILHVPKA